MREKTSGIYCIENLIDGKKYIGCSANIENRWQEHKKKLIKGNHINAHFQNAWNKYKKNNFKFWIIQECSKEYLKLMETYWIIYFDSYVECGRGYNLTMGGEGLLGASKKTREKMSNFAKNRSDKYKENLSKSLIKHFSDQKNRERLIGKNNGFYGKKHSEETKEKIRKANEDLINYRKLTDDQIIEIVDLLINKVSVKKIAKDFNVSEPTIYNIKNGNTWKNMVDEDKISQMPPNLPFINRKLNEQQIKEIRNFLHLGDLSENQIGEMYGIDQSTVSKIKNNQSWKHV